MGSNINALIAGGIKAPQTPDLIGTLGKVQQLGQQRANIAQTQAQTGLIGAQQQEATAQAGAIQTAAQGTQIENALKLRHLNAMHALSSLLQANSVKNPDGTTSTNMPAVMSSYRSQFPDYALDLQLKQLSIEQNQTNLQKSNFGLQAEQNKRAGLVMGLAGVGDPNAPIDPQKYAALKQQGDAEGWGASLPTPADYAKNPAAYAAKLADVVNQSGSKADVLKQQQAQLEVGQAQRGLARNEWNAMLQQAHTPQDYAQDYTLLQQKYPDQFPQLNLIPPSQVTSPDALQWSQQAARLGAMGPKDAQQAVTDLYKAHATAHLQQLQGIEAGAQAQKASTEAGVATQTLIQNYGVTPGGEAVQAPGAPTAAPIVNLPGNKGQIDLSKADTPQGKAWSGESPAVQRMALAILGGAPMSGNEMKDPIASRAMNLATKVDPQIRTNAAARQAWYDKNQGAIVAMNAATGHSQDLIDLAHGLDQRSPGFINEPLARLKETFGNETQAAYNNVVSNYTAEIGNAIKGGALTQQEGEDAIHRLGTAKTLGQVISIVKSNGQLLYRRGEAMNKQFNQQLGGNILGGGIDVFQPQTHAILEKQGAAAHQYKVGDRVTYNGKPHVVKSIGADGKLQLQ